MQLILRASMDEAIIANITVGQSEEFIAEVNRLDGVMQDLAANAPDIEIGAILDDADFLAAANELVNTANMTADEANAYFAGIGYEPVYNSEELDTPTNVPNAQTTMAVQNIGWNTASMDVLGMSLPIKLPNITYTTKSSPLPPSEAEGNMRLVSFSGDGKAPPIRGLRKKATGAQNNYSSSNKGGGAPSGGGGGVGGGGDKKQPKTSHKADSTI